MRVTFLSPRLPPAVCGLADHTRFLAEALVAQGVEVGFIHGNRQQQASSLSAWPIGFWDGSGSSLATQVARQNPDWLWVQLSAYGYSRWGAPYRLGSQLHQLQNRMPAVRLAICLHEAHCMPSQLGLKGPILSPWQKYTVGRLARLGHLLFVSTEVLRHRAIDDYAVTPERVQRLPIGSNIPDVVLTPLERKQRRQRYGWSDNELVAVTFGSFASQIRALRMFERFLVEGFALGALDRVVCLGGECSNVPPELTRLASEVASTGNAEIFGHRPAQEVGEILACCDFAFCATPLAVLEKSGAFMACASAELAVLTSGAPANGDGSADKLPVASIETWDWRQARSPFVERLRRDLRRHAENNYRWQAIAEKVVSCLRAQNLSQVVTS